MSNETLFFIFGIALAVSAVLVSIAGLRVKGFPGRMTPLIVVWFGVLVVASMTFAVRHGQDESRESGAKFKKAGEEIHRISTSGPFETAAEEANGEGAGGEAGGEGAGGEAGGEGAAGEEGSGGAEAGAEKGGEGAGSEAAAESPAEEKANAQAGSQVFASAGCSSCHTFKAAGASGTVGPDLEKELTAGTEKAKIEEDIVDPEAEIASGYPAGIMPQTFGQELSSEELRDVVDFLYVNSPAGK